jgi:serine protease AprX
MARITINGVSVDPLAHAATLASAGLITADASASNYVLIQTAAPLTDEQKEQLADLGAVVQEYVSENTYLCGYKPTDLGAVRALPFVTWANVYLRGFKVNPALRDPTAAPAGSILPQAVSASHSHSLRTVDVVLHDDVDPREKAIKAQIAAAVGVSPDDLTSGRHKIRLKVQEKRLDDLAAIDEVRLIEEVPLVKLRNDVARKILNAPVVLNGTPFQGAGQVVAVADTGFDRGRTTGVHPAFTGRVAKLFALGRPGNASDPEGHGTHVCGSVLGNGKSPTMGGVIQGTAPKARLVVQSLLDASGALGGIPADLHDLFEPPFVHNGARVHTNSWGATEPGLPYSQSSREIDDFVWNHQDCVICFAAGNDGIDRNGDGAADAASVGSEAAAKNCITVGASESDRLDIATTYGDIRPSSFPKAPLHDDPMANHPEGMAAFSSRGPTKEGRIKPDLVAPGTSILSTRSRAAVKVPTIFGTSSDPDYFFDAGTSMATPLVAGCVAVLRECLVKNGTPTPPAALIKALLINGAVELTGQYNPSEAGPSPNTNSGFGRVDLANSVIIPGPHANAGFGTGGPLRQGESNTVTIKVPASGHTGGAPTGTGTAGLSPSLKVTLVWSDPPGDNLQNDLDLIVVVANGQERHGNMGVGQGFDRLNNVEQVVWSNVPPGNLNITVRAFRITKFPQPYAFAWRLSV